MISRSGMSSAGALLLGAACSVLAGVSPALGQDAEPERTAIAPIHLEVNFSQSFQFGAPCASTVPVGDTCIDVTLTAPYTELGPLTVSRIAFLNVSLFNPSTPTCIPIETQGTVTLRDGTIGMRGVGSVCLADGTASYNLIVTGGTGRYEGGPRRRRDHDSAADFEFHGTGAVECRSVRQTVKLNLNPACAAPRRPRRAGGAGTDPCSPGPGPRG